jgi:hypothetical protein
MLQRNPNLDHVTDQIDSILVQLEDPTLDKVLVRSLFAELSLLFDQMIELRRRLRPTIG